jgi:hypothetical protein
VTGHASAFFDPDTQQPIEFPPELAGLSRYGVTHDDAGGFLFGMSDETGRRIVRFAQGALTILRSDGSFGPCCCDSDLQVPLDRFALLGNDVYGTATEGALHRIRRGRNSMVTAYGVRAFTTDRRGRIYLAKGASIVRFDPETATDEVLLGDGKRGVRTGVAPAGLDVPRAIVVTDDERLFVADEAENCILVARGCAEPSWRTCFEPSLSRSFHFRDLGRIRVVAVRPYFAPVDVAPERRGVYETRRSIAHGYPTRVVATRGAVVDFDIDRVHGRLFVLDAAAPSSLTVATLAPDRNGTLAEDPLEQRIVALDAPSRALDRSRTSMAASSSAVSGCCAAWIRRPGTSKRIGGRHERAALLRITGGSVLYTTPRPEPPPDRPRAASEFP